MRCVRCLVTGIVQGVWFRGSTQKVALRLGLKGRAINLSDGSVEVIVCGEEQQIELMRRWLKQGPELAKVKSLSCDSWNGEPFTGFSTH